MFRVTVYDRNRARRVYEAEQNETLMQLLGRHGIFFRANCGGNGRCRQCEVLVDGVRRRSCQYRIDRDCKVVLLVSFSDSEEVLLQEDGELAGGDADCVCVDLGTTTIAMALLNREDGTMAQAGMANSQRMYGADVVARIQYASQPQGCQRLRELALYDLRRGLSQLFQKTSTPPRQMDCYVSGNPTMLHILGGHSPESIGRYPFTPTHPEYEEQTVTGIGTLHLLPCASGYIGSDVTIGAYYHRLQESVEPCLYLDLGTNGEMLLAAKGRILSASVAAGPAFEQFFRGSKGIAIVSGLLADGIVDRQGALPERYQNSGYPCCGTVVTQDAIRQLQLAKAAVRAGMDILARRFGCALSDVQRILVAGGFGFHLQEADAIAIGMFPETFQGRVQSVGNASLSGTIACRHELSEFIRFQERIENVDLAMEPEFAEEYIRYMNFP